MKVAELHEARADKTLTFWQRLPTEVEWVFWGVVCGYGTKIWWVLGWSLLLNFLFTSLYSTKNANLEKQLHPDTKHEFTFRLRLLDFPREYLSKRSHSESQSKRVSGKRPAKKKGGASASTKRLNMKDLTTRKFMNALGFSSVILFKVGYKDTTVSGRIGWLDLKYIVALEWALGFYLLAALMVTLANTQPLINRLITGVF